MAGTWIPPPLSQESTSPSLKLRTSQLAGTYKLVATYGYDREKYIKECKKNCPGHSSPEAMWNRCDNTPLRAEAEFVVR